MCKLMEDYGEKIRERSRAEGRAEGAKEIALTLWNRGFKSIEEISQITKLPLDEVKKLLEGNAV